MPTRRYRITETELYAYVFGLVRREPMAAAVHEALCHRCGLRKGRCTGSAIARKHGLSEQAVRRHLRTTTRGLPRVLAAMTREDLLDE